MKQERYTLVEPGKDHMSDPIEECPFPTSQLTPPYPLTPEDRAAIAEQKKRQQAAQ